MPLCVGNIVSDRYKNPTCFRKGNLNVVWFIQYQDVESNFLAQICICFSFTVVCGKLFLFLHYWEQFSNFSETKRKWRVTMLWKRETVSPAQIQRSVIDIFPVYNALNTYCIGGGGAYWPMRRKNLWKVPVFSIRKKN